MTISRKTILALAGAALTLGACASDPYYNGYNGYGYSGDRSYAGPAYYDPYYGGPGVGFGLAWSDRDGDRGRERHFRDRDGDRHDRDGDRHDRDGDQRG